MTLSEHVVALRRTLNRLITRRLAEQTDRPFLQLRLLRAVAKGRVRTQAEAAEHLLCDPATVCRLVDKLEADDLVERREGKDRRTGRLVVTPAARPQLKVFATELDVLDAHVREHLTTAEYDTLLRLVMKLQDGLNDPAEQLPVGVADSGA